MILEADKLCFSYVKGIPVLHNISLGVEPATITCLMCPNGSGKTTLIDCFMGNNRVETGEIKLLGKNISSYKRGEIARHIAYIPQSHAVTFPYTVREVVLMGRMAHASIFGSPRESDREACENAMKAAGVDRFADRAYSSLSGGEIRLVLLARALCQQTEIILMDEPAAFLDFRNDMIFLESVTSLVKSNSVSVVIATHFPNHGFYFESNDINVNCVMLSKGEICLSGSPTRVITPQTLACVFGVEASIIGEGKEKTVTMLRAL